MAEETIPPETQGWVPWRRSWWRRYQRTWGIMVPLHLAAFVILYLATYQLMQSEVVGAGTQVARDRLRGEILQLLMVAQAHPARMPGGHQFAAFMAMPRPFESQLYTADGSFLAGAESLFTPTAEQITDFLERDEPDTYRIATYGADDFVDGLSRIASTQRCVPCHQPDEVLGVATMHLNVTTQLGGLKGRLRRNLALLLVVWASALGLTTAAVKRSAKHAAHQLQQELDAAETGEPAAKRHAAELALDPVTAQLHRSVREFLAHHRQRRSEMASRLAHTDQLASLGRLAAGLAHEIKNPLAGIQGALEILQLDSQSEANRGLYEEMLKELKRVNETLQLMLSSARPSPVQLTETDVHDLLEELRTLLEPSLRRQDTRLLVELATGPVRARLDRGKIRQVLVNLINNAADAMESGGTVTIRAAPLVEAGGIVLSVHDDGPGIPDEQQQRIFEPFFSTKFTGTGLGLAIARSLVEQHGGTLEVESEPDKGSTFLVLLPAETPVDESPPDGEPTKE
jgi:signal transduction histidine kinase